MHHYVKPVHALKHMQPVFSVNKSPQPPTPPPHTHRQNNADSQMIGNLQAKDLQLLEHLQGFYVSTHN